MDVGEEGDYRPITMVCMDVGEEGDYRPITMGVWMWGKREIIDLSLWVYGCGGRGRL